MRTIYVDTAFRCHVTGEDAVTPVETDFFDGKCQTYVEGYRLVPKGKTWTREDGVTFPEGMTAPWKPYAELAAAQAQYEADQAELLAAYREGVNSL